MSGTDLLGEFERLVLLAVLQNPERGYAIEIRQTLEEGTGRSVSRGALYRTLDRLEQKEMVASAVEDPTEARGGHPRKRFHVEPAGIEALRRSRRVVARLSQGLGELLGETS